MLINESVTIHWYGIDQLNWLAGWGRLCYIQLHQVMAMNIAFNLGLVDLTGPTLTWETRETLVFIRRLSFFDTPKLYLFQINKLYYFKNMTMFMFPFR